MSKKRVLFVCVENSNRSQIAQAFATMHGGSAVEAFSAGSRPSGVINPKAIAPMRELGYDLTRHASKALTNLPLHEYDFVATMGCGDSCAAIPAKRREDWQIPDPKQMEPVEFNQVRDLIEAKVKQVVAELTRS